LKPGYSYLEENESHVHTHHPRETAGEGRESEKVARFMLAKTVEFGLEREILDVRD